MRIGECKDCHIVENAGQAPVILSFQIVAVRVFDNQHGDCIPA